MKATTVGIDLAKNLVQVHGVDERGRPLLRRQSRQWRIRSDGRWKTDYR
jgi:transposase